MFLFSRIQGGRRKSTRTDAELIQRAVLLYPSRDLSLGICQRVRARHQKDPAYSSYVERRHILLRLQRYHISQIVDRTSVNLNINAKVKGAEVEAAWEPLPGLRFNFSGGLEDSSIDSGQSAIDFIDRTAGIATGWCKPYLTSTSNCILPSSVVRQLIKTIRKIRRVLPRLVRLFWHVTSPMAAASFLSSSALRFEHFGVTGFNPAGCPATGKVFPRIWAATSSPIRRHSRYRRRPILDAC